MTRSEVHETAAKVETAFLVGVDVKSDTEGWSLEASLDELAALADTAGLRVVGTTYQRVDTPNPSTFIGSGKVEEVKSAAVELLADVVVMDHEMSPRQQRNLEKELDVKVLDRTALILDIFAQHARTREGMLQVELAQYEYRLPRLTRMWTHLARQAGGRAGGASGGVGVRGPGETQLEIDRREIQKKIRALKDELEHVRTHRQLYRDRRTRAGMAVVALVGYTNAGKC
jgi:GTP-binding protein HflX